MERNLKCVTLKIHFMPQINKTFVQGEKERNRKKKREKERDRVIKKE